MDQGLCPEADEGLRCFVRRRFPTTCRLRRVVWSALQSDDQIGRLSALDEAWAGLLDVHHVVAAGLERAAPARVLLATWSVSLNSLANAAVLPRWFHQGRGLHRSFYVEGVNRRLVAADGMASRVGARAGFPAGRRLFLSILRRMGDSLCFETGDALAARLQAALRRCDPELPV